VSGANITVVNNAHELLRCEMPSMAPADAHRELKLWLPPKDTSKFLGRGGAHVRRFKEVCAFDFFCGCVV
jgi:hypothetical protein